MNSYTVLNSATLKFMKIADPFIVIAMAKYNFNKLGSLSSKGSWDF